MGPTREVFGMGYYDQYRVDTLSQGELKNSQMENHFSYRTSMDKSEMYSKPYSSEFDENTIRKIKAIFGKEDNSGGSEEEDVEMSDFNEIPRILGKRSKEDDDYLEEDTGGLYYKKKRKI